MPKGRKEIRHQETLLSSMGKRLRVVLMVSDDIKMKIEAATKMKESKGRKEIKKENVEVDDDDEFDKVKSEKTQKELGTREVEKVKKNKGSAETGVGFKKTKLISKNKAANGSPKKGGARKKSSDSEEEPSDTDSDSDSDLDADIEEKPPYIDSDSDSDLDSNSSYDSKVTVPFKERTNLRRAAPKNYDEFDSTTKSKKTLTEELESREEVEKKVKKNKGAAGTGDGFRKTKLVSKKKATNGSPKKGRARKKGSDSEEETSDSDRDSGDWFDVRKRDETNADSRPHRCNECGKRFRQQMHLAQHQRIHTVDKPYMCRLCGRNFRQQTTLNQHLLTHTGEKPYECDYCNRTFRQRANLNKHLLNHKEKPYECDQCKRTFRQRAILNKHLLIHSSEKPYECDYCERTFRQRTSLNQHILIHSKKKPYECLECGKHFRQKSHLDKHARSHHSDESEDESSEDET